MERKEMKFNLIQIQNNAIPLFSWLFFDASNKWAIPEKIGEFHPSKDRKGVVS